MALYAFDGTGNEDRTDDAFDSNVCDFFHAYDDPLKNDDPSKERGSLYQSRAIIDACKPYEWRDKFPPANEMSAQLRQQLVDKWGWAIRGEARPSEIAAPMAQPVRR